MNVDAGVREIGVVELDVGAPLAAARLRAVAEGAVFVFAALEVPCHTIFLAKSVEILVTTS